MKKSTASTISSTLDNAVKHLNASGIATARLDCLVLLEDVLDIDRSWILAHPEFELSDQQRVALESMVTRRAAHEPLAYIRQKTEFYGREFYVDAHVLEPRPESEDMIELLAQYADDTQTIIDVGTGSGALAITAAIIAPDVDVYGVDVDPNCLAVAKKNAVAHDMDVTCIQSDLLSAVTDKLQDAILLCNLPYVPDSHTINSAAMFEPELAIFGGEDGLDLFRKMFQQITESGNFPRLVLTESLPFQHAALAEIAAAHGYAQDTEVDFIQAFIKQ